MSKIIFATLLSLFINTSYNIFTAHTCLIAMLTEQNSATTSAGSEEYQSENKLSTRPTSPPMATSTTGRVDTMPPQQYWRAGSAPTQTHSHSIAPNHPPT